ncbi:MAG: hypothetical protein ABIZ95_06330 [Pyrinomonadaceae bacterium]
MNFLEPYQYTYYRIYDWNRRMWGDRDIPEYNAMLGMSMLVYANFLGGFWALYLISGIDYVLRLTKLQAVLIAAAIVIANYFLFLFHDNYKVIVRHFHDEPKILRSKRLIWIWLYVIASIVIPIIVSIASRVRMVN